MGRDGYLGGGEVKGERVGREEYVGRVTSVRGAKGIPRGNTMDKGKYRTFKQKQNYIT